MFTQLVSEHCRFVIVDNSGQCNPQLLLYWRSVPDRVLTWKKRTAKYHQVGKKNWESRVCVGLVAQIGLNMPRIPKRMHIRKQIGIWDIFKFTFSEHTGFFEQILSFTSKYVPGLHIHIYIYITRIDLAVLVPVPLGTCGQFLLAASFEVWWPSSWPSLRGWIGKYRWIRWRKSQTLQWLKLKNVFSRNVMKFVKVFGSTILHYTKKSPFLGHVMMLMIFGRFLGMHGLWRFLRIDSWQMQMHQIPQNTNIVFRLQVDCHAASIPRGWSSNFNDLYAVMYQNG